MLPPGRDQAASAPLPTKLIALETVHPDQLAAALRATDPPVIARIEGDRLVLGPRTVLPEEERELLQAVVAVMRKRANG